MFQAKCLPSLSKQSQLLLFKTQLSLLKSFLRENVFQLVLLIKHKWYFVETFFIREVLNNELRLKWNQQKRLARNNMTFGLQNRKKVAKVSKITFTYISSWAVIFTIFYVVKVKIYERNFTCWSLLPSYKPSLFPFGFIEWTLDSNWSIVQFGKSLFGGPQWNEKLFAQPSLCVNRNPLEWSWAHLKILLKRVNWFSRIILCNCTVV